MTRLEVRPTAIRPAHAAPKPVPLHDEDRRIADLLPAVLHQAPFGVAVLRRDRTVAYANDELVRLLGREDAHRDDVPLPPLRHVGGGVYAAGSEPLDRVLATGEAARPIGALATRTDGSSVELSIATAPILEPSGRVLGAVLYVEDPSRDVEDRSLGQAFVGVLSHELRTPITAIYGGTQLLLDDGVSAETRASVLHDIAAEAEQLHRLVEDLLAIARIERGLADPASEPLLLQRLVVQAARAEERRWPGRRVEVRGQPGLPAVRGDDGYTTQILRNLISNAVKYSPPGEPVVVTVVGEPDAVAVAVLDRGPGFPPGVGADAFRLFYQSPAVASRVAGTGIGLFVARALVEAQGGRIWLERREGGGSVVGFALPSYAVDGAD